MGYKMEQSSRARPNAVGIILFALVVSVVAAGRVYGSADYADQLDHARLLLKQQNGRAAFTLFKTLLHEQPSFSPCLGAARALEIMDQPENALQYYHQALEYAGTNAGERRISLFGIAKMLMWLERYPEAERTYEQLLLQPLSNEDHAVAAAGLARCLSFQDKPMRAYRTISENRLLEPAGRIELARAALWSGRPDKAAAVLASEISVEPDTRMARELEALRSELQAEMATPLDLHAEFISDSDDLRIRKSEIAAGAPVSATGKLGLVFQHQGFEQRDQQLAMNSLQARFSSRPGEAFTLGLQAGPAAYGGWRTALWSGSLVFRSSDEFRLEAFVAREAVETLVALERHTRIDTIGLAAAYAPVNRILLSGSAYRQSFRDDNNRVGGTGKIAIPISKRIGLDLQLRARYFEDSRTDTIGYFNPKRFHQEQLLLALNRRIASDWRLSALVGPGVQNATPGDGSSTTLLSELSLKGRVVNGLSLSLDYGYSNSAVASSSGYRRHYSGVAFSCQW